MKSWHESMVYCIMNSTRYWTPFNRIFFITTLVFISALLLACTPLAPTLPQDAREALADYWQSLPSEAGIEHTIVRSWPGLVDTEAVTPWSPEMEIWCVEATMSSTTDASIDENTLVWIVFREDNTNSWSAALLATMSSTWPYEACGV